MSKYYFVGSGIASLAGAAYLIRDGNVDGRDIVIFEESRDFGGALDAHGNPSTGYFMSGSRMFENKYNCTFDLMSSIPSSTDPDISVTDETNLAKVAIPWHNRARLVDRVGKIVDAHRLGFIERDRMDLLGLLATSESHLDGKRVSDCFNEHFFQTNFWIEWSTLFAFQRWHSAIEFRRYLLRFIHHFSTIDTQEGIYRTVYNQYDSMAVPLAKWLNERGVRVQFETVVDDLRFNGGNGKITVESIECTVAGLAVEHSAGRRQLRLRDQRIDDRRQGVRNDDERAGPQPREDQRCVAPVGDDCARPAGVRQPGGLRRPHRGVGVGIVHRHLDRPRVLAVHGRVHR